MERDNLQIKHKELIQKYEADLAQISDEGIVESAAFQSVKCEAGGGIFFSGASEAIAHMTHLGYWSWDLLLDKVLASAEVFRMCGLKETGPEMDITLFWDLIHPGDDKAFLEAIKRVLSGKKTSIEYRIVRPDGTVRYIYSEMVVIPDNSGKPYLIFSTDQDITERKQTEEWIRYQNKVLEGINRIFHEALTCPTKEDLGHICLNIVKEVTGSKCGFIGEMKSEGQMNDLVRSDPDCDVCCIADSTEDQSRNKVVHNLYEQVVCEGRGYYSNTPLSYPASISAPKAHPFVSSFLGVPLLRQGKVIGAITVCNRPGGYGELELAALEALSEVIVQVLLNWQAEKQLADDFAAMTWLHSVSMQYEDNFDTLLHAVLDAAIAITRADKGNIQLFDPVNRSLQMVAHRGFDQSFIAHFKQVYEGQCVCGEAAQKKERVIVEDVANNTFLHGFPNLEAVLDTGIRAVQSTPLIGRSGRLVGMISTHWCAPCKPDENVLRLVDLLARQAADLIERKQSEEALRESEERYRALAEELRIADCRKDEFLGILSHEIRNPLTSIMLCLSLLQRSAPEGEQSVRTKEIMGRQVAQLSRLVDDLLDVTRITRNKIVLQKELLELNELVGRTVEDYQEQFREKGVTLSAQLSPDALYVNADPARLSQVLGNLLHNATKFTEAGGTTWVSVSKDQFQHVKLCVEDNGIGMSPQMIPNLFQSFMQADTSLGRNGGGLGLGLALVKGLTELHGGTVSAYSGGLGKGSLFTIRLPLADVQQFTDPGSKVCTNKPFQSKRILIIEDMIDVAEALKTLLVEEGHEVMVAYDGAAGIDMAKKFHPDVLLCDIGLPGINGYQVAQSFSEDDELKNVYRISLTGYARPEDLKKAEEAGFHCQLAKPVDPKKLIEILAR